MWWYTLFIHTLTFWLGANMGSFINVVGLRFLKEESIIWPASRCPQCEEKIQWYDNIPIFSWILLGGKCRYCKGAISPQYPIIEFLTGFLVLCICIKYGYTLQAGFLMYLTFNFMVILITDFREQYIFDVNSLGLIPFGLIYTYFNLGHVQGKSDLYLGALNMTVPHIFVSAVVAVVGAFCLFFVLNLISRLTVGKPGFGEGDTRLLMGIGSFFGLKLMAVVFLLGFALQALVGLPMLLTQWIRQKAYKTAGLMGAGLACAALPYGLQLVLPKGLLIVLVALVFGTAGMICAFKALRLAKELPTGLTYLPFGPALVLGTWLIMFFQGPILSILRHVLPV